MDSYAAGGIGAGTILVIGVVYKLFHHLKCASKCCGYNSSFTIDLGTPPNTEPLTPANNNIDNK